MENQENNNPYLSIDDMVALHDVMKTFDDNVSGTVLDEAEFFNIEEDEESLDSTVTLFDKDGKELVKFIVDDYEMALMYMTELFDVEDEELESMESAQNSRYGHSA